MGTVFTWDDVQHGRIPSVKSFLSVTSDIRERIVHDPSICSAVVCGSVLRGDYNRRSDIDCIIVYDAEQEQRAVSLLQDICRSASMLHVPVNFVPVDTDLSASTMHHLGVAFVEHISSAADNGGLIKGDLPKNLRVNQPVQSEVRSYVRSKMYNLEEGWTSFTSASEERKALFLKKVLELPLHMARKVLYLHDAMGGDSKVDVCRAFATWADSQTRTLFEELLALDSMYTTALEKQLSEPNRNDYINTWNALIDGIPKAVRFARLNAMKLSEPYA